jgi:hypothetical protein
MEGLGSGYGRNVRPELRRDVLRDHRIQREVAPRVCRLSMALLVEGEVRSQQMPNRSASSRPSQRTQASQTATAPSASRSS